jgi:murein DD-endopeptidase MepM/ murein hydrolase activator NlpD
LADLKITSLFGLRKHPILKAKKHPAGIDLKATIGTDVLVIYPGKVIFADKLGSYGNFVSVLHVNGVSSHYAHLDQILVSIGHDVWTGQRICTVGNSGGSTGAHLHFEVRVYGEVSDPLLVFRRFGVRAEG